MGKDRKFKNYKHQNQKPYKKDNWRNQKHGTKADGMAKQPAAGANRQSKQDAMPKVSLREDQVGITEFVSKNIGFTGIVKSRFSDFHVNEIDLNDKVLKLTDLSAPEIEKKSLSAEEVAAARAELSDIISAELWEKITALAAAKSSDAQAQPIEITMDEVDKEQRTKIHKVVKQLFSGKLVSTTLNQQVDGKEQKLIRIMKPKGGKSENRSRWTFPGEYVYFLVHKENLDTSEVAAALAARLNLRPSQVNYCGTKDKRAKTTQRFCIKRRTPVQIKNAAKALRNVFVGNFEFSNEVLKLGDLKGNRFRIALRHISGEQQQIEQSLKAMREQGFINYFGLQRFGNCAAVPTYEVGVALLKSDYKTACELILKPRDNDLPFLREIRETWWKNRDSAAAAAMFRNDKFIEKKLLNGLAQYGENDYSAALRKIPRNMLLLYPHAFQSLIFNRIASRRIKEYGLQLMVGDLVYRNKDELDIDTVETIAIDDTVEENEKDEKEENGSKMEECEEAVAIDRVDEGDVENAAERNGDTKVNAVTEKINNDAADVEVPDQHSSIFKCKVKALTADDIASGNYTLFDVVLPLPGYDIAYPENVVGTWYEEMLEEYGLSSKKLRHNVKTYAMAGAYRKLLIKPTEMSWKFCTYDKTDSTLILSDWEELKAQAEDKGCTNSTEGKFKALILEFCLPTSAYATMLLRELLKTDTSAAEQMQLEQQEFQKVADKEKMEEENRKKQYENDVTLVEVVGEKRKVQDLKDTGEILKETEAKKLKTNEDAKITEDATKK